MTPPSAPALGSMLPTHAARFERVVSFRSPEAAPDLIGASAATAALRVGIAAAARSDAKVLIIGETGVGKEVVARRIHAASGRRHQPFVAINCAGMPDALLESELFGHVRGAFTGAYRDKAGLAAAADRGTLFLDELGEMSPRMQGVLLRFAQTGEIHPIGSDRIEKRVDVRIIAATNRNLLDRIRTGDFREDLYYRLNVVHIAIPPLRDRTADIMPLFEHYLKEFCRVHRLDVPSVSPQATQLLMAHVWPGNVRELKNVVERIVVRNPNGAIEPELLPVEVVTSRHSAAESRPEYTSATARILPVDRVWNELLVDRRDFWSAVRDPFMDRELTKSDVREIVSRGLQYTQGNYRKVVQLFHLPDADYKKFLAFLYQHNCHVPYHPFREPRERQELRRAD